MTKCIFLDFLFFFLDLTFVQSWSTYTVHPYTVWLGYTHRQCGLATLLYGVSHTDGVVHSNGVGHHDGEVHNNGVSHTDVVVHNDGFSHAAL